MANKKPRVIPNTPQDTFRTDEGQTKTARRGTPLHAKLSNSDEYVKVTSAMRNPVTTKKAEIADKVVKGSGLTAINGIGPALAKKFEDAGFDSVASVAESNPADIASKTGVAESSALNIYTNAVELIGEG